MRLLPFLPVFLFGVTAAFGQTATPSYDVVVYSGVPCGISASIAAAREGAKTLLIEPTRHVGGLNTSGLNTAETEHMLKWTFGGIAQEFYTRLGQHYGKPGPAYYFESGVAEKTFLAMLNEAKVEVRYGQRVEKVEKDRARIRSITLSDGSTVTAKVFIDAGYEGDLMARAGVSYTWGREAREEFNEEAAGIRFDKTTRKAATVDDAGKLLPGMSGWARDFHELAADKTVMNYNWRLCFSNDPAWRVPIPEPQHYDRARYRFLENWLREKTAANQVVKLDDIIDLYSHAPNRPDKKEVNNKQAAIISIGDFGAQREYPDADYATRDKIIAEHTDYTLGLFHFLATDEAVPEKLRAETAQWGLHKEEFADNGNWPYQLYVREARRMRGAYVMTQRDVQEDRRKPDAIAMGSHFIDCHHVQRLAVSPTEFINEGRIWRVGYAYQIPYRALTPNPTECTNLLVAGAASYTHVAFCTYRLESTWMMGGHAAGVAAALAAHDGKEVQSIDVSALQEKLRAQKQVIDFLPGEPEKFPDTKTVEF
ncbi:MAG: FAD-dependent oxidoreductase [Chthoniobacter sp.]|nr:FAD-dependent oxidoreductase [Chthoniobacter sp.]